MRKILTTLCAVALLAMAVNAMAAPGDVKKIESPKADQKLVGGMPEFVLFKQNNGYIAIWTPEQIVFDVVCANDEDCMCVDCVTDYFYKKALKVTGSGSLDGFANGVEFFSGNNKTTSNNGNNTGTYQVIQRNLNEWVALSSGGKISIVIYGEGAPDPEPEDPFSISFWLAIHFDKTNINASTTTMSLVGENAMSTGQGFGYLKVDNLRVGVPQPCFLYAGSSNNGWTSVLNGTDGEFAIAWISLERTTGDCFVICIDLQNFSATSAVHIDVKGAYDAQGNAIADPYKGLKLPPGQYGINTTGTTHFEIPCELDNGKPKTDKKYAVIWELCKTAID